MHATGRQPQRAPDCAPLHYERHRPEQTTLYRLVQQHAASFIAHAEASTGSELPRFIKDEFDAFLECGILAHGFLRPRCGECGHDRLLAFSCKRRGFCPGVVPIPVERWSGGDSSLVMLRGSVEVASFGSLKLLGMGIQGSNQGF
ncbi:MAG: transposase zinc-binding domain-containing protein, partial [Tabrizicola sp.]